MKELLGVCYETVCGKFLPLVLFISGIYFSVRLCGYIYNFRFVRSVMKENCGDGKNTLSSLWLALGGTLAVGNICGMASAVTFAGPGCVFWIWVCALLSAVTKYSETVLSVITRQKNPDGRLNGGPYFYIKQLPVMRKIAPFFVILTVITAVFMGNVTQVKSASEFALAAIGIPKAATALFFFLSVFLICTGKGKKVIDFTSAAVPLLCVFYTFLCVVTVAVNYQAVGEITVSIFREAFTPKAAGGGIMAIITSKAFSYGLTRGIMSNEAGCGTAPIAYASGNCDSAVKNGFFGIAEVLIDTLFLCTLTAYAVLLPGAETSENSARTVLNAFGTVFGSFGSVFLTVSVCFFALASVSAWSFYVRQSLLVFRGGDRFSLVFSALYPFVSFFGCFMEENIMWIFADISVSLMAIINITAVLLLFERVRRATAEKYSELASFKWK